jgi:S-adenosylmethionine-diacylgycerolhomoserine-N-methlytransferase
MNARIDTLNPHATAMDRMYRFQRHIYDASRYFYLLGRDELLDRLHPPSGGSILEIGCGTGRNLIGLGRRYPDVRLFGVDISEEMLKSALQAASRAGLARQVTFAAADATSFNPVTSFGQAQFDRVMFSYSLSMIPDWRTALGRAARFLSTQGELHVADFGQCEKLPPVFSSALKRWLRWFSVTPRSTLPTEMEAIARTHGQTSHFESKFGGYAWLAAMTPQQGAHP